MIYRTVHIWLMKRMKGSVKFLKNKDVNVAERAQVIVEVPVKKS